MVSDLFTVCNIQTGLGCILPDKLIKSMRNGSFIIDTGSN